MIGASPHAIDMYVNACISAWPENESVMIAFASRLVVAIPKPCRQRASTNVSRFGAPRDSRQPIV